MYLLNISCVDGILVSEPVIQVAVLSWILFSLGLIFQIPIDKKVIVEYDRNSIVIEDEIDFWIRLGELMENKLYNSITVIKITVTEQL